jgi:hypothetical protein
MAELHSSHVICPDSIGTLVSAAIRVSLAVKMMLKGIGVLH